MSEYAAQLLRRIEAIDTAAADNRRRAEAYERMEQDLKAVEARVSSPDGVVTVAARGGGELSEVTFSERVREVGPAALSATVQQTIATAVAEAARLQAEVVRRELGSTELLDRVVEADRRLFGDQPPSAPTQAQAAASAPRSVRGGGRSDDDWYENVDLFEGGPRRS